MKLFGERFYPAISGNSTLVVILHGWANWPARYEGIRTEVVRQALPEADVLIPALPYRFFWSMRRMSSIVARLARFLDAKWVRRQAKGDGGYKRLVIIGHSGGSQLARALLSHGFGRDGEKLSDSASSNKVHPWAPALDRIVMLGGVNRGWSDESPVSPTLRVAMPLAQAILAVWPFHITALDIRRGAAFLTTLRLRWLAMTRDKDFKDRLPTVVQLIGTRDDIVSPEDNIDLATGGTFHYLEVKGAGHFDVIDVAPNEDVDCHRRAALRAALVDSNDSLKAKSIALTDLSGDPRRHQADPTVDDVVFIIHGIRDHGYWTHKLGATIRAKAPADRIIVVENPSYGFFPILPFLVPAWRQRKVEWLMDRFVEARALYPNARISAIGHSNGTYLLASAIEQCPAIEFERLVFVGSVVHRRFDWAAVVGSRIKRVFNIVANGDLVVAFVPKGLQPIARFRIGSAGHDGFTSDLVSEVRYIQGGHSEGIREERWADLADMVLAKDPPSPPTAHKTTIDRIPLAIWLGRLSSIIVLALATLLLGIGGLIIVSIGSTNPAPADWAKAALGLSDNANRPWYLAIGYLWVLRAVLMRL